MNNPANQVVVGIGEALLRLEAPAGVRLSRTQQLHAHVAGTELNTLVLLQSLGVRTRWLSRLPGNHLGRLVLSYVRAEGVEPVVSWSDGRLGLYFLERGGAFRPHEVLYDRDRSAATELSTQHVDVGQLLRDATVVHSTGITLGLGSEPQALVRKVFDAARGAGQSTSLDINYRAKLWSREEARAALLDALDRVDVLFASQFDLEHLLSLGPDPETAAMRLRERHGCAMVVVPHRIPQGGGTEQIRVRVIGDEAYASEPIMTRAEEPIGVGDAIAGGFLSGWLAEGPHLGVQRAAAAGALKSAVRGDALTASAVELDRAHDDHKRVIR